MFKPKVEMEMKARNIQYMCIKPPSEEEIVKGMNLILIFGCPANKGVPATSKMATQFFKVLEQA